MYMSFEVLAELNSVDANGEREYVFLPAPGKKAQQGDSSFNPVSPLYITVPRPSLPSAMCGAWDDSINAPILSAAIYYLDRRSETTVTYVVATAHPTSSVEQDMDNLRETM